MEVRGNVRDEAQKEEGRKPHTLHFNFSVIAVGWY